MSERERKSERKKGMGGGCTVKRDIAKDPKAAEWVREKAKGKFRSSFSCSMTPLK